MPQIVTFIRLFFCCLYLSSCFRYHTNSEMLSDFQKMQSLKDEKDKYCYEISLKFNGSVISKPLPPMYTEYGKCLEQGFVVAASSYQPEKVIAPNSQKALEMYSAAAQCSDSAAIEILNSRGEPVPPFSGREAGEYYFPLSLSREQDCGFHENLTGWGYLFIAPIAIPVGAVILVGAFLTIPVCVVTSPFHSSKCI